MIPVIRDATPDDAAHILRLVRGLADYERVLHKVIATEDDIRGALFGPSPRAHAILAAPPGQAPVALALFYYTLGTFTCRRGMFLEDLFVDPAHRGTGAGLALMRHLARRAVDEGCSRIDWWVLNWNEPSIAFYDRIGSTRMTDWQVRQLEGPALLALAEGA